tara:strand:- start:1732 stop:3864 length:2133 start_codon:yes stop_codon:yes gene_type:complete
MNIFVLFFLFFTAESFNFNNSKCYLKNKSSLINMNLKNLRDKNGLPKFSLFKYNTIEDDTKLIINDLKKDFKKLEEKMENTKSNFYEISIYEREKIFYPIEFYWGVISHLTSVKNNNELRTAHENVMPEVIKIGNDLSQSKILYNCLKKASKENLNSIQKRIIKKELKGMELNGVNLEDNKKEEFREISLRLANLSNKYRNNVLDSVNNYKMIIKDDKNMLKMPEYSLELYSEKAKTEGFKSTPKKGPWVVTLDGPSLYSFMTKYPESDKRKDLYKASIKRASEKKYDNTELVYEILKLNQKLSELLGYKNYVDISLSQKMATESKIYKLLNKISKKSKKKGIEDYEEIKSYFGLKDLNSWDVAYYSEKLKEDKFEFKEEDVKPYLVYENVLEGLFKLSKKIFDISIVEVNTDKEKIDLWNEDVKYFRVYDGSDSKNEIASFYLDPYIRPGEKKGGAWMDDCVGKSKYLNNKPVAYLTLNGTPPLNGKPSLMTFSDVETLFHEFGHGLQHMLTEVDESAAAGINNIEWDAVELPSQFMENWCYHKKTLMSFAKHYQTNKTMPDDLYNKIMSQKTFHKANQINRQIYFSMIDLYVYQNDIDDIYNVQKKISDKYLAYPIDKEDRFLCSFEHIFSGGYSAGYYSYKWAEIMSLDAFSVFENVEDDKELKNLGMKFRKTILAKGGGTDPLKVYKEFMGREPNSDAFMKHYGLI